MWYPNAISEINAKEKWCPCGRIMAQGNFSHNRTAIGEGSDGSRCLGHKCMMFLQVDTECDFYYCGLARGE